MIRNLINQYIFEQLINFRNGSRCCQQISATFRSADYPLFLEFAFRLGFYTRPYISNGIHTIRVFKKTCLHYVDSVPELHIKAQTVKDLFLLQCQSDFIGSQIEMQISPEFLSPTSSRPAIPAHRFSMGLKQSMARENDIGQKRFQNACCLQPFKTYFLDSLKRNRVLVVNSNLPETSTGIPMYLIESCAARREHCKIICVEREQILAIHNSELLSDHLGEIVGDTIAFQIHMQSRISEGSNLIYTTAHFLLRVLMGQSVVDSFRHISHIVVCDVHRREAFSELLMCELRAALRCHAQLKVILLSDTQQNSDFLKYFGEGEAIHLENFTQNSCRANVMYLEDVRKLVEKEYTACISPPIIPSTFKENYKNADQILEYYELTGSDNSLQAFLYIVHGEFISVNYRHSVTGRTALIIAAKLGSVSHITTLLEILADPYVKDNQNLNALSTATVANHTDCIALLNAYFSFHIPKRIAPKSSDFNLVMGLIKLLTTSPQWDPGNIMVIVSDYEQLLHVNFSVLRLKLIGDIPQRIAIFMLHNKSEKEQLEAAIQGTSDCINIIIATDIIENIKLNFSCSYIIDSARVRRSVYIAETNCNEIVYEWMSKNALEQRTQLTHRDKDTSGACFRLIPKFLYEQLPKDCSSELLTMQLDRICLTVKLLSPHTMVSEYLQRTISRPPFIHIYNTVELLKKMDVFDEFEDVTWLGCRLIDIHVDCQHGKLLVLAILLQCLDPILTIVSFLSSFDPLDMPSKLDHKYQPYIDIVRHNIKEKRKELAAGAHSDHLIYVRLYQEWQNDLRDDNQEIAVSDEHQYVLNGILERVCDIRTYLVGTLRASQLIHSQGLLSMHNVNLKANSWPMVKATLVAGLYPKICIIDRNENMLKSNSQRELVLNQASVLRNMTVEPLAAFTQKYPSEWIVYGRETDAYNCNTIFSCTLVSPFTVALFAGPLKIDLSNIFTAETGNNVSWSEMQSNFYIDDWIEFKMKLSDAQLVLKTRQYLYCEFMNFLQNCSNIDHWRRPNLQPSQAICLLEGLHKMLTYEDHACGFTKPVCVGLRPKAVPNKFIATFNAAVSWERSEPVTDIDAIQSDPISPDNKNDIMDINFKVPCLERKYFLVYVPEFGVSLRKYSNEWLKESVIRFVEPLHSDKLTFVIMYRKNPDQFCSVALAKKVFGAFKLQEYFKNEIPVDEIINICTMLNLTIPSFDGKRAAVPLDPSIGKLILELFAFRNNWLYKKGSNSQKC